MRTWKRSFAEELTGRRPCAFKSISIWLDSVQIDTNTEGPILCNMVAVRRHRQAPKAAGLASKGV